MHTFAQKQKPAPQAKSTDLAAFGWSHLGQSREVNFVLQLQRMIGNQAVQNLLQSKAKESVRFTNDLGAIPYVPETSAGNRLLTHEPPHVLQHSGRRADRLVQCKPSSLPAENSSPISERKALPARPNSESRDAQKAYYLMFLLPLWRGQQDQLGDAQRQYRYHLLAMECLRVAKGPGADPVRLAEFCRSWKIPLTLPFIGPTALLRKIGKAIGGWPSPAAVFDPTGAINIGTKVISQMVPLLGRIQMHNALLVMSDVVDPADQGEVGSILESCSTPRMLTNRLKESKNNLERVWKETVALAEKMERIRLELGLPETVS